MNAYRIVTRRGEVSFLADTPQPAVLAIHGFRRSPQLIEALRDWIPGVGFIALPGHGEAPDLDEVSLPAWIAAWREALPHLGPPPLLIGESLGAILAMCLPARAVTAVEPPLSVENLWPLRKLIRDARARGVAIDPAQEALFDRPFDWVLDEVAAPTLLLAGDKPLLPERETATSPSLLTDEDFARYAAHPLIEAHRMPGGHSLLVEDTDGVVERARAFFARFPPRDQAP